MMLLKKSISALLLTALIPIYANAQNTVSDSIDVFLQQTMKAKKIPALQLAIVQDGEIVKQAVYGTANLENNIPATPESIFSINSITKAFTGVAIMQLAEAGKLKVTDPLGKHLNDLPKEWQQITLQQVLSHVSGLPDMDDADGLIMGKGDEQLAMADIVKHPMVMKTGEKFIYNQMCCLDKSSPSLVACTSRSL